LKSKIVLDFNTVFEIFKTNELEIGVLASCVACKSLRLILSEIRNDLISVPTMKKES
jgi:hypothetical protein